MRFDTSALRQSLCGGIRLNGISCKQPERVSRRAPCAKALFYRDMEYKISNRCKGCQFRILDHYCTALSEYMTAGGSRKCIQDDEPPCSKFHKKIKNPYIAVKYR